MSAAKNATPGQLFTDLGTGSRWAFAGYADDDSHPWVEFTDRKMQWHTQAEAEAANLVLMVPEWSEALKTRFHGKPHLTIADLAFEAPVTDTPTLDEAGIDAIAEWRSAGSDRRAVADLLGCDCEITEILRAIEQLRAAPTLDVNNLQTILRHAARAVCLRGHDPSNLNTVMDVADYLTDTADRIEAEAAAEARDNADRERAVAVARAAFRAVSGIETAPADGWIEAVVDALADERAGREQKEAEQ